MSYLDQLDFGLVACPDTVDDVWQLGEELRAALDELVARAAEAESVAEAAEPAEPAPATDSGAVDDAGPEELGAVGGG